MGLLKIHFIVSAHFHDVTYDHIGKKYCWNTQRAQPKIQEQSSNTEEQANATRPLSRCYL